VNKPRNLYGSPGPLRLTLQGPDRMGKTVDFMISASTPVTDIAYLLDRELCTPGVIDVTIVEKEEGNGNG